MKRSRSSFIDLEASIITSFLRITSGGGGHTPDTARQFLEATGWKLDDAIQLFYAAADEPLPNQPPSSSTNNTGADGGGDSVRPALPVRRETLYGQPDSAFSDSDWEPEDNPAALSRPPLDLMFHGSFQEAKAAASAQNKWLMVNLQSATEFSSHMLNRDTWAHEVVDQVIGGCFVFWQKDDDTVEGKKVKTYYRLDSVPAVVVIDPVTGQKMKSWRGMVEPERLLEDIVQFTDSSPADHHAAAMSQKRRRLHAPANYEEEEEEEEEEEDEKKEAEFIALPEEEPNGDTGRVCRVGIRLPDGRRFQRKFIRTDPVHMLWSFCNAKLQEVQEGLKGFRLLVFAAPGAYKSLDYGTESTFEESGVADSLISLVWE